MIDSAEPKIENNIKLQVNTLVDSDQINYRSHYIIYRTYS